MDGREWGEYAKILLEFAALLSYLLKIESSVLMIGYSAHLGVLINKVAQLEKLGLNLRGLSMAAVAALEQKDFLLKKVAEGEAARERCVALNEELRKMRERLNEKDAVITEHKQEMGRIEALMTKRLNDAEECRKRQQAEINLLENQLKEMASMRNKLNANATQIQAQREEITRLKLALVQRTAKNAG